MGADKKIAKIKGTKLPEAFLFLNAIGRPYTESGLRKIWQRACKNAKVPYINFYNATRHSMASQATNRGVDLKLYQNPRS
jgi:site-specific recombinase XerD